MIELKKFEADWCGPCRMLKPTFQKLEETFGNSIKFSYINVDESQDEAAKYSIRSIPAVVIVKDGKEVNRLVGVQSEMAYSNALNELL
jgi:thioredoxin|tara:strand:- start:466 stop:729 length:264 start_codon:yes stop_codon:yes gene_type:complete